jgi:hypothetical protein
MARSLQRTPGVPPIAGSGGRMERWPRGGRRCPSDCCAGTASDMTEKSPDKKPGLNMPGQYARVHNGQVFFYRIAACASVN